MDFLYPTPKGVTLRRFRLEATGAFRGFKWAQSEMMLGWVESDLKESISLWRPETRTRTFEITGGRSSNYFRSFDLASDGSWIAVTSNDGQLWTWDFKEDSFDAIEEAGSASVVAISPDHNVLAVVCFRSDLVLLDAHTHNELVLFQGHEGAINALAWAPQGQLIASASEDRTICIWNSSTLEPEWRFEHHSDGVESLAWSPNGLLLASGSKDRSVCIWDAVSGSLLQVLEFLESGIDALSFSRDGKILGCISESGETCFWRRDTWEVIARSLPRPANSHDDPYGRNWLSFHPTLDHFAIRFQDENQIRIWDLDPDTFLGGNRSRKSVHYTTAKIALVGDAGVGKTALGWRLAHGDFKEQPSSHGQQFWVVNHLNVVRTDGTACEAVLWDLAGQPDYRLIHTLFLDDVDCALILFDPTNRQDPLKEVTYWLKQLSSRRAAPVQTILVASRVDRGYPTMTKDEINEFCHAHDIGGGVVFTSAQTGEGIDELLAMLKAQIPWDAMPATVTTDVFKQIKSQVLELKQKSNNNQALVDIADLHRSLRAHGKIKTTREELTAAISHLESHGFVRRLRSASGQQAVLLAPELLANLASSFVIEARRNPKGLGALEESRVLQNDYEFPELGVVDPSEQDILLDAATMLFIDHNVCFRESFASETLLVFPSLINQKRPASDPHLIEEGPTYFISGNVENVYSALVVLLGYTNTFTRTNQWQNQAEYEMDPGEICGFRLISEREGEIQIVLYYGLSTEPHTRVLFQSLFEKFLAGRRVTVRRYSPVSCSLCGYTQERTEIIRRLQAGKTSLYCGDCGARLTIAEHATDILLSRQERAEVGVQQHLADQRTHFESAIVQIKRVLRDRRTTPPSCFLSYAWGDHREERWVSTLASDLEKAGITVIFDRWDNAAIGSSIGRFISRIEDANYILVVGTPTYREKYQNRTAKGNVVAAEVDLLHLRMTQGEAGKRTVLPALLAGEADEAFPPLLQGRVYADFRSEKAYFATLFDLLLTMCNIPPADETFASLQESLAADTL